MVNRVSNRMGKSFLSLALLTFLLASCANPTPAPVASEATAVPTSKPPTAAPTEAPTESAPATEAPAEPAGMSPENPLPRTEMVLTPDWEIQVLDVLRGEEAMTMLEQASTFNKAHEDAALEYVLVKLHAKYVGTGMGHIYGKIFRSLDSANEIYDSVSFIDVEVPQPELEADLAPGEETEGWVAIQAQKDATGLMLVVWPYDSYENNTAVFSEAADKWYISLE
jgi:hypothetical protein